MPSTQQSTNGAAGNRASLRAATTEQQLHALYRTALDALLVLDDERRCLQVNGPGTRLLGAPPEEVLTRRLEHFTAPEHRAELERLWSDLALRGSCEGAFEVLRGDGSRTMVEFRATWNFGSGQHLLAARETTERHLGHEERRMLTPREREVLQLAADGSSTPRIAEQLVLSPGTVKTHFQRIYKKLGAHDRASAVAQCLRRGLIE